MTHPITLLRDLPVLDAPVLVAAFEGWNDAGEAASSALSIVLDAVDAEVVAEVDAEQFYDFSDIRPLVGTSPTGDRELIWPSIRIHVANAARDLVIIEGVEPNLRWPTLIDSLVSFAARVGVETSITLGALQVDRPHTRPVSVTGGATDPELSRSARISPSTYEGPTGITGVLGQGLATAGLRHVSLWAGVPHYLAGTTYIPGVLALLERLGALTGVEMELGRLAEDAEAQADDVARLLEEDAELADYVEELERRSADDDLVDGERLAAELERFLRDRGGS